MDEIIFLQTHIDYSTDPLTLKDTGPIITMYGLTLDKTPIKVEVANFMPYFYAQASADIKIADLENEMTNKLTAGQVMYIEKTQKMSIYGYSNNKTTFFKIFVNAPSACRKAKALLEGNLTIKGEKVQFKVFESKFPFVLRFMSDTGITGMSYVKCIEYYKKSTNPLVIKTEANNLVQIPLEGKFMNILPLKILSFDIECCGSTNDFPTPKKDPIIQIGNTIQRFGETKMQKDIFCLKETANIPGANVHWFETEFDMLNAWKNFMIKEDPDIVLGYNIKNFDFPYILDRAEVLKIKNFGKLGRSNKVSKAINKQQSGKSFGTLDAFDIEIDGRMVFDVYQIIRRDYKLRSYSLNSVSVHFLGEQKEDVPYNSLYALQHGDSETRKRIATYCLRDTYLPMRIFDKLNILINFTELARATKVPIEYFSTRGSAIKVLSQIYNEAKKYDYVIPDMDIVSNEDGFEGASVMEPIRGFYYDPIAVLDFTSLYPSIMISKNLCYTTLLSKEQYGEMGGIKTPTGNYFCNKDSREGLLPRILVNLLSERKKAKKLLKEEKDPAMRRSLDGRQLALKICANSIYGFTGATVGQLPCLEISQSVTGFGREMIATTKRLVEDNFSKARGFTHDSVVIYGDTDSVMINFEEKDIHKVFEISKEISAFVTSKFENPISLEFEKVYCPYLLINKKRYAGLIYTDPNKASRIDTKGIETVRRDNCELVKNVIEKCLDLILWRKDVEGAQIYVKKMVRDLYLGEVDISQLVISKSYTKSGDQYGSKQAHVELAKRLKERGIPVGIGDRIAYVIVKGDKKSPAYEKSEDPVYVLENSLPIDTEYYIEQQLSKPVHRIFEPIMDNVSVLFSGDHTKVVKYDTSFKGPMNAFLKPLEECIGCKKTGKIICEHCVKDFPFHLHDLQTKLDDKLDRFHACWVECQRCQGSLINPVLCVNRDCPIFYMRTKVKKELVPLTEKMEKLKNINW